MDVSRYHPDMQKILHQALQLARRYGHPFLEVEHVAYCLVKGNRLGIKIKNHTLILDFLSKHLEKSPKIYGLKKIEFGRRLKAVFARLELNEGVINTETFWSQMILESTLLKMLVQESIPFTSSGVVSQGNGDLVGDAPPQQYEGAVETPSEGRRLKPHSKSPKNKISLKKVESFVTDLTELAESGQLTPLLGRDFEIKKILQILGRHKKNNPLLIGEPGVGKSALAEGVAWWLLHQKSSELLKRMRVLSVDIGALIAGTKYRGEFEERMRTLMDLAAEDPGRAIFFIDEVHMIIGAGNQEGGADIANLLKPALARGVFRCMAATTYAEYKQSIQRDTALVRRFQTIFIEEPTRVQAIQILRGLKSSYEKHHDVEIGDDVLEAAVELSVRYMPTQKLPDKALDLVDDAASIQSMSESSTRKVTCEALAALIEEKFGIKIRPDTSENSLRRDSLIDLETRMAQKIFGQWGALRRLGKALRRVRAGLTDASRTFGNFLFVGPMGVGKYETARTLATEVFGDESRLITIDLAEFTQESSVHRLVGSPPGFLGYEDGGLLADLMKQKPFAVVFFDHLDRAHEQVLGLLGQILEDGKLIDRLGRVADFTNALVIFSITIGEPNHRGDDSDLVSRWNDLNPWSEFWDDYGLRKKISQWIQSDIIHRIDEVIIFRNLSSVHLHRMLQKQVDHINEQLVQKKMQLRLGAGVAEFIVVQGKKMGAAALKKLLSHYVLDEIAERLLSEPDAMEGSWDVDRTETGQMVWTRYDAIIVKKTG